MQASEIRRCDLCGEGLCKDNALTFHRVQLQRYIVDVEALNERAGLQLLFQGKASAELIEVFATKPDVAVLLTEPADLLVCELCAAGGGRSIFELGELAQQKLEERKLPDPVHRPKESET